MAGDSGTRCPRNRRYSRSICEKSTPISLSLPLWCDPLFALSFFLSLSAFIISDLIKLRRAACSAMKHLLAVCYKIVVGEERWWGLISHYAKTVAISPPHHHHHHHLHTYADKNLPWPEAVLSLKLSHTLSFPSLTHFEPFLHQWQFSLMLFHLCHQIRLFLNSTPSKLKNPSIRTLFSSGKPPTIICWAAGVANIRLLGEREVLQLLSIACVYDVQPEQKSYICLHQQWAINLTLSELKFPVI